MSFNTPILHDKFQDPFSSQAMPANSSTVYGRRPGHARGISKGNDVIIEEPRNFQDNA